MADPQHTNCATMRKLAIIRDAFYGRWFLTSWQAVENVATGGMKCEFTRRDKGYARVSVFNNHELAELIVMWADGRTMRVWFATDVDAEVDKATLAVSDFMKEPYPD